MPARNCISSVGGLRSSNRARTAASSRFSETSQPGRLRHVRVEMRLGLGEALHHQLPARVRIMLQAQHALGVDDHAIGAADARRGRSCTGARAGSRGLGASGRTPSTRPSPSSTGRQNPTSGDACPESPERQRGRVPDTLPPQETARESGVEARNWTKSGSWHPCTITPSILIGQNR